MANERLAYNPATPPNTGFGYTYWSPSSNIAIPDDNWSSSAGGFAWWMSPTWNPVASGVIARLDEDEEAPAGPWTWYTLAGTDPNMIVTGYMGSNTGTFSAATTEIYINESTYEGRANGIPDVLQNLVLPFDIFVRGAGPTPPFMTRFTVNAVNLGVAPGVCGLNVAYVSGNQYTLIDGQAAAISTLDTATPEQYRSRGTFSFFGVDDITLDIDAAKMAVRLGIPGCTLASTKAQVKANAQLTNNFWVSW